MLESKKRPLHPANRENAADMEPPKTAVNVRSGRAIGNVGRFRLQRRGMHGPIGRSSLATAVRSRSHGHSITPIVKIAALQPSPLGSIP